MKTARAHRKFAIFSNFLDTILEGEEDILEGETRKEVLLRIHRELVETADELREINFPPGSFTESEPEVTANKSTEQGTIAAWIADIFTTTSIKVLESYQLLANKYPEVKAAYDMQHKKLSK